MRTGILLAVLTLVSCLGAQESKTERPSPAGTAELTLNGKKITVAHSRPKIRDPKTGQPRKIFGDLVPYGKVWRTGANEPTTLKTEASLDVNGTAVPAGTYSLFTIPDPDKWTLIISKKTSDRGMPYPGEGEDLARVAMTVDHPSQVVDPFTITLEPPRPSGMTTVGAGGPAPARLCIAWENTRACVNLNPK
jgi:Protein of unknown function (DUF2911)